MVNTFYFILLILIFHKLIKYVYDIKVYIWYISVAFQLNIDSTCMVT